MTQQELLLWIQDEFGDWIDGEDPVLNYAPHSANSVWVKFDSGSEFVITVEKV
jgi:hypothetical protein